MPLGIIFPTKQPRRIPHSRRPRRHILQHHRPRTYLRPFTDRDIPQNTSPSSNQHPVSDLRVPIPALLPRPSQRHVMQNRHIIPHHRRLPDHDRGGVIEENTRPDLGPGVEVHREGFRDSVLDQQS